MGGAVIGSVVLSNLAYLIGAAVMTALISTVLVLRQRRPKSTEANVETFHRGLRALAPPAPPAARRSRRSDRGAGAG